MANAIRTASPFQHGISNTSAAQPWFEAGVSTSPSCGRWRPRPAWLRQQQARPLHQAVDTLVVGAGEPLRLGLTVQESSDPPVAIAQPGVEQGSGAHQQLGVDRRRPAQQGFLHMRRDFELEGLAAEPALKLADPLRRRRRRPGHALALAHPGNADVVIGDPDRLAAPAAIATSKRADARSSLAPAERVPRHTGAARMPAGIDL